MEFELLGQKIEISEGRKNYMKILADYKEMANRAEKAFQKDYEDSFALTFFSSSYAEKAMKKYSDSMLDGQAKTYLVLMMRRFGGAFLLPFRGYIT